MTALSRWERGVALATICRALKKLLNEAVENLDETYTGDTKALGLVQQMEGSRAMLEDIVKAIHTTAWNETSKVAEAAEEFAKLAGVKEAGDPYDPSSGSKKPVERMFGATTLNQNKTQPVALTEEQKKEMEARHVQRLREKEQKDILQKKLEKQKIEEEESAIDEKKRRRAEIIREVASTHPQYESVMAFLSYLNDNKVDAYSPKEFTRFVELHGMKPEDFKAVLEAQGKYAARLDRPVHTPSELIEQAAQKIGVHKQQVMDAILKGMKAGRPSPLSMVETLKAYKYRDMDAHQIRVHELREKQNRNTAEDGKIDYSKF